MRHGHLGAIDRVSFRTYVEKVLLPVLRSGDLVTLGNLGSHRSKEVRQFIRFGRRMVKSLYLKHVKCEWALLYIERWPGLPLKRRHRTRLRGIVLGRKSWLFCPIAADGVQRPCTA